MKNNLLISTIGKNPDIKDSLMYVIDNLNIKKVIYLVSSDIDVKKTYQILREYCLKRNIEVDKIDFFDIEHLDKIFETINKSSLLEITKKTREKGGKIYLDFTYGTKSLSGGILFYSLSSRIIDETIYITGTRNEKGIVIANFEIVNYSVKRFYLNLKYPDLELKIRQFRYLEAKNLIESIFSKELKVNFVKELNNFIDYFQKLISGKIEVMPANLLFSLKEKRFFLDYEGLFENNRKIKNYENLEKKAKKGDIRREEINWILNFKIGYFYDLIRINFNLGNYPETLALTISFLDHYFTLLLWENNFSSEEIYFEIKNINFHLKKIKSEELDYYPPTSVSLKLNLLEKIGYQLKIDKEKIKELILKRNASIFGHGFSAPSKEDAVLALHLTNLIIKERKIDLYKNNYFLYYPFDLKLPLITP